MPRTLGLVTRLCLPLLRDFLMTVAFLGLHTYSAVTRLFVLVPTCIGCVWRLPFMYISALYCALGTLSEFSSVPILVADELVQSSSCETRS